MNSWKISHLAAIAVGACLALYLIYTHLGYFTDVQFLGALVGLEILIACIWNFEVRFFFLLQLIFLWAGMHVPFQTVGLTGRWVMLAAGAAVGFILWIKNPQKPFRPTHLIAFFCICMAGISASVSSFVGTASLKAVSLGLLFLYCASGARLAVLGREQRFFNGLILGSEILVYGTTFVYFVLHEASWGNPNSLGAAMSICLFPLLLWGWLTANTSAIRNRRLLALLLCTYLIRISLSRAAFAATIGVALVVCLCLRQYRLLVKMGALAVAIGALGAIISPAAISNRITDAGETLLYKGHKEGGVFGSRRGPWDASIASIKAHPLFGTGYGTSPTVADPSNQAGGTVMSTAQAEREHGSSYITIVEWVGMIGVLPFIVLLALTLSKVWKVCLLMRRTGNVRYYSVPVAMVVLGGFIHGTFEDWIFAAGSYLALFFWICAFLLVDLAPEFDRLPALHPSRPVPVSSMRYGVAVPNR